MAPRSLITLELIALVWAAMIIHVMWRVMKDLDATDLGSDGADDEIDTKVLANGQTEKLKERQSKLPLPILSA